MEKKKSWFSMLLSFADGQKIRFVLSVVLSVTSVVSGLVPYYCIYRIVEQFSENSATAQGILMWCAYALLFYIIKSLFFSISTWLSHKVAFNVVAELRKRVADRFLHAPLGEVGKSSIGQIKNIIVEKIEQIEPPMAHVVPEGAGHIVLPVVSIIALATINWKIALSSLVTVPAALVCMMITFKISGESFQKYNDSNAYMNSTIVEYIEGIEVIKAFGRAGVSYEKYAAAIKDYKKFVLKWMASTWVTMKLAFALFPSTILGTLPVSLYLASKGVISTAQTALAVMLSMSMVSSLARLEVFSESTRQMKENIESLAEYLYMKELPEPPAPVKINDYSVKLSNVHFSYDGNPENEVLHGIDLNLKHGTFNAVVGPSGSGKSTIAKLIARFWDTDSGKITIGGTDIKDMPLSQLSGCVSFVTQDNFLFRTSIMENIRIGNPDASDDEVKAAAKAAMCDEFINKLPQGYDTPAGDAGKRLSGGEKQRIAIARMMLKNAPVIILDEATAFTDPENEDKIQQSINKLTKGKTLLVIAHRLSTIREADNIIVLDDGKVSAQGTHEELLEKSILYRKMWQAHIGAKKWAVESGVQ